MVPAVKTLHGLWTKMVFLLSKEPERWPAVRGKSFTSMKLKNVVIKIWCNKCLYRFFPEWCKYHICKLPDTLTTFKASVFRGCTRLTEITIPESVQTIGNNVFIGCTKLKEITIPASVQKIGNSVFTDCKKLTTVHWTEVRSEIIFSKTVQHLLQ